MATDYSALLHEYPEIISLDQLYQICHISKRKAVWLLEHQHIPCQDSGKKTWRFKIKTADVVKYLEGLESDPHAAKPPVGIFSSKQYQKRKKDPISNIPLPQFKSYLYGKWKEVPDALQLRDIVALTGYTRFTVGKWLSSENLKCVHCPSGAVVAKEWLVDFIAIHTIEHPIRMTAIHKSWAVEFLRQNESETRAPE